MNFSKTSKIFSIVIFTFFSISLSVTANAASLCKGLSKSKCGVEAQCGWVNSYTTKKGTTVKAFCRGKRGAKTVKRKSVSKKISSNTTNKVKVAKKSSSSKNKVKKTKSKAKKNLAKNMVSK